MYNNKLIKQYSDSIQSFDSLQKEFIDYMTKSRKAKPATYENYRSWLKFLATSYSIDTSITDEFIESVLTNEDKLRLDRTTYIRSRDISNFRSALRAFRDFANQRNSEMLIKKERVEENERLPSTEIETIIQSRRGQDYFRERLIKYWQGCSITGFKRVELLIASHIKPWKDSNDQERVDEFNGLLLLPNIDKLFDSGFLSFNENGKILCSRNLSSEEKFLLGINETMSLIRIDERHKPYLKYHRENCFRF